jgi:hypothetical protein
MKIWFAEFTIWSKLDVVGYEKWPNIGGYLANLIFDIWYTRNV